MKIAACVLVRNGMEYFEKNINNVLKSFTPFCKPDIFVVENDSTDGTKDLLQAMYQDNRLKKIISLNLDNKNSTELCLPGEKYNCKSRVKRLAYLRQVAIDAVLDSRENYSYLCMIDLDFVCIPSISKLVEKMQKNKSIDGIFGISMTTHDTDCIYDGSALGWINIVRIYFCMSRFVNVSSAFGGIGLYRFTSLKTYGAKYINSHHSYDNEHIDFNSYFKKLVVDTEFRLFYSGHCHKYCNLDFMRRICLYATTFSFILICWIVFKLVKKRISYKSP